jgi:predicted alpha-1,6-mannanase (GH76 family)
MIGPRIRSLTAAVASVAAGIALAVGMTAGPSHAAAPHAAAPNAAAPNAAAPHASSPASSPAAASGVKVLMAGYNSSTGLIGTNGWWTSAVALSTVMTYQQTTGDTGYGYGYAISGAFNANKGSNFENSYLDDTGWWGLAWLQAYDVTGNIQYLRMAETDAGYIHDYWDSTCGGGVWWSTAKTYKNAIPNELFLDLTATLHNRIPGDTTYLGWANAEWNWFNGSGMINSSHLVNDGLNSSCQNNGQTTWTYNQGVILAGLAELSRADNNSGLLTTGETLANASTAHLAQNGIVVEPCEPSCGSDGPSFKGIYVRGLRTLATAAGSTAYDGFLQAQANSIIAHDTNSGGQLGLSWAGPFQDATSGTQASAEAALVVALGGVPSVGPPYMQGTGGRIAAGVHADYRIEVFAVTPAGGIKNRYETAPDQGWSGWSDFGPDTSGTKPTVVSVATGRHLSGRLEVFAVMSDGSIMNKYEQSADGAWSNWSGFAPRGTASALTVGVHQDGRLELFAVTPGGGIKNCYETAPDQGWSTWNDFGPTGTAPTVDAVTTGQHSDGRLEVFAVMSDGSMKNIYESSPGGKWSPWSDYASGATADSDGSPGTDSAGVHLDGRMEVFAVTPGGGLQNKFETKPSGPWTSTWSGFGPTGTAPLTVTASTVSRHQDGRMEVLAVMSDGSIMNRFETKAGGGWSGWSSWAAPKTVMP